MKRSMIYGMLVLFLLFMITANPSGTGENGREFVGWISSGWDDARAFVDSFVEDPDEPEVNELGEVVIPTVPPEDNVPPADSGDGGGEPAPEPASG